MVRTIGIVRARLKIGLQNLAYNMRRLATLERIPPHEDRTKPQLKTDVP